MKKQHWISLFLILSLSLNVFFVHNYFRLKPQENQISSYYGGYAADLYGVEYSLKEFLDVTDSETKALALHNAYWSSSSAYLTHKMLEAKLPFFQKDISSTLPTFEFSLKLHTLTAHYLSGQNVSEEVQRIYDSLSKTLDPYRSIENNKKEAFDKIQQILSTEILR